MKFPYNLLQGMFDANATINEIIHLPTATLYDSASEALEDFISSIDDDFVKHTTEKFPHLRSALGCFLVNDDSDYDIENMQHLYRSAGDVEFIAQVYVAIPYNIKLDDEGNFFSCSRGGVYRTAWFFGNDMQQIAEQAIEFGNQLFEEELKKTQELTP